MENHQISLFPYGSHGGVSQQEDVYMIFRSVTNPVALEIDKKNHHHHHHHHHVG